MTRQFGRIAMIDVMSICVLTLLILSVSAREESEPSRGVDKLFASEVMTARVECHLPEIADGVRNVPALGLEVVLQGQPHASANPRSKVLGVRAIGSAVFATFIPPTYPTRDDYLHIYVKDRGLLRPQDFALSLHVENHPSVQRYDGDPFPATELSWRVPLHVANGEKTLRVIADGTEGQ